MNKVLLGDVVKRVKDKVDKSNTNLKYYIGGEHFDNGEIVISKKGTIQGSTIGPAFHMRFKPGNVLLMSRNPHLRKAGVVNFEGICSDVSYVCETKDESVLKQSFLPFIFQSDDFWGFAEANKKGSTNFFLNWSDFEKYEFNLPNIKEQEKLSELLWAANDTKEAYKNLLLLTNEFVKSQFMEMIDLCFVLGQVLKLNELIIPERPITYGILKPGTNVVGGIPVIKVKDFPNGFINQSDLLLTTPEIDAQYQRSKLLPTDLLISIRGSVGRMAEVPENLVGANITQDTARLSIKPEYDRVYVRGVLESYALQKIMQEHIRGIAVKGINIADVRKLPIAIPDKSSQERLASIYRQSAKAKFELKQTISSLENTVKSIIKQYIG